ncbi:MAG: response regulator [Ruminiclostridium sp.]|nr:response regulator [Ruminiclostridium sp.]
MTFKILLTGKNRKIIASDISKHIEDEIGCETLGCQPLKSELMNTVISERPRVIIILLNDESPGEVKLYDILRDHARVHNIAVIVIANEEDKRNFMFHTGLEKMMFLPRQFSLTALCDKLAELKTELAEEEDMSYFDVYEKPPQREFPRRHILAVDDDITQLETEKEMLKDFFEVTVLNNGKYVIRALEKLKVDLILLDYIMPKVSGYEVLSMIKSDPRFADIPVIFLTGVSEKEIVTKTINDFKPQGYLLKPASKPEMIAKIVEVLG